MIVGDLADWVMKHRRGRAFQDWTFAQIVLELDKAIESGTLCYTTDERKNFTGVAVGIKDDEARTIEVVAILTSDAHSISQMARFYQQHANGYDIITHDKAGNKVYQTTDKFIERLIRYGRT